MEDGDCNDLVFAKRSRVHTEEITDLRSVVRGHWRQLGQYHSVTALFPDEFTFSSQAAASLFTRSLVLYSGIINKLNLLVLILLL